MPVVTGASNRPSPDPTQYGVADIIGPGLRRILAPNPSALTGPGTNTYLVGGLVGGARSIVVIDPGPAVAAHLHAILTAVGPEGQISHIFVTHPHRDHSGLARELADITAAPVLAFGTAGSGRSPRMQALAAQSDPGGGEGNDDAFVPDICLAHQHSVMTEAGRIDALHCPGHMGEHLCFAYGDILFSGDHVMGWSSTLVSPPDGDMGAYMASLHLLAARRWRRFLPGHGGPVEDPAARLAELGAHRRARAAAILAVVAGGPVGVADITARVYADIATGLHLVAARNVFAHLVDLVDKDLVIALPELGPHAQFQINRQPPVPGPIAPLRP